MPRSRYDLTMAELAALPALAAEPAYRARQVWEGLYRHVSGPEELTALPARLRAALAEAPELRAGLEVAAETASDRGTTVKWLFRVEGGDAVETVLMHYPGRTTVCVSSQAGCAMACGFCATGQAGFRRHLSTGEIVEQVARATSAARSSGRRLSNVVFMGMGEPLANYDALWGAIQRLHEDFGISARHITVSTVGLIPGIRKLAHETLPVNLAVSLHAANDKLRSELVPVNRRYPIGALMAACNEYLAAKGRRLSFEWACIAGVNDRTSDAEELAELALPLRAHVNLIPLNPTPGYAVIGTSPGRVRQFAEELADLGVNATVRQNRGTSIDAACGQLAARVVPERTLTD
ncbi:MAG TPA: 23S rRNA (adenine(2503)-C(2))-methyltransferase RlmN [Acidimicrobiales bacterium]|nr:23S rRNA (adenine(2503)-C(2))-methyltransferase RlmN [Acidimicrobiales bacterium]